MQTQLGSVGGRVSGDDGTQGRSRLRFGSVPPNVKFIDNKPVYVVMHSDREYGGTVKPAVYDPYYGVNYVPSNGRDSWSAYHISDAALDDNDELVLKSRERDSHFLKEINRKLGNVLNAPSRPPPSPAKSKVTPRTGKAATSGAPPKPPRVPTCPDHQLRRLPPLVSATAAPTVGDDYFKSKLFEQASDLRGPSDVGSLRSQLRDTSVRLDKERLLLDRYRTDREADEFLDLRRRARSPSGSVTGVPVSHSAIPARRFDRASSLQPESSRQKLSPVRSHIREVLERTRKK